MWDKVIAEDELASTGRAVLPDVERRLSSIGIFSAWRLQPDTQIGILHLGDDQRAADLARGEA